MKTFDALDPAIEIRKSFLLEASAGTGKTFSIENIVARAISEEPKEGMTALSIKDILIVTFTKAAAKELKERILRNLQEHARLLQEKEEHFSALQRVKRALVEFDSAHISTIHAFCYRAIVENASCVRLKNDPEALLQDSVWRVVEKYFRTELDSGRYTPIQLNILLKSHQSDVTKLVKNLIKTGSRGILFSKSLSNAECLENLESVLKNVQNEGWTKEGLLEAFEKSAYSYYGACEGKLKVLKKKYAEFIRGFLRLLDLKKLEMTDVDPYLESFEEVFGLFASSNLKKSQSPPENKVLAVFEQIAGDAGFSMWHLANENALFARLSASCQEALFEAFEKEGTCDFSYLLMKMKHLVLEDKEFKLKLQNKFKMVIIDEFQDTDPTQWKIFKELFLNISTPLILVGDPKQSIYAFRSADIYTYLDAKASTPQENLAFLRTNYRSTPELIEALNHLFNPTLVPGWVALPYLKTDLPYIPLLAPKEKPLSGNQAIQFLFADASGCPGMTLEAIEEAYFFPRFLKEIKKLAEVKVPLSEIAFLVRDRLQSDRLFQYLQSKGVSAEQKRQLTLNQAAILQDFIYLLAAMQTPRHLGRLQTALGTVFFQWSARDLEALQDPEELAKILLDFHKWNLIWKTQGVCLALESFLETHLEILLSQPEGLRRYHEFRQLMEWIGEKEADGSFSLIEELQSLLSTEASLQEPFKLRPLKDKEAVQILTVHMSKGLEFEAVFVLGVINRSPKQDGLILTRKDNEVFLKAVQNHDPAYEDFLEESDAEKARQFYVALTRARSVLYIPYINGWKAPVLGCASPLELWLARAFQPQSSWKSLYERFQEPQGHVLQNLVQPCPFIALEKLEPGQAPDSLVVKKQQELIPPDSVRLRFPQIINASFTALAKKNEGGSKGSPRNFQVDEKTVHTLPAGAYTGEFLHKILQEISFSLVKGAKSQEDLNKFISRYTAKTVFEGWENVLAEIMYGAFKIPIGPSGFTLDSLTEGTVFREMEFMCPLELVQDIPECGGLQGVLKGVVDLFFVIKGKYYLLDWKSHWLESYEDEDLRRVILEHRYDLQATLYERALKQYLLLQGISFEEVFGGTIFFFLRKSVPYFIGAKHD